MKHMPEVVEHEILQLRIQKAFPERSQEECQQLYTDVLNCVTNKETYVRGGSLKKFTMLRKDMGITICVKYIVFMFYFIRYFVSQHQLINSFLRVCWLF